MKQSCNGEEVLSRDPSELFVKVINAGDTRADHAELKSSVTCFHAHKAMLSLLAPNKRDAAYRVVPVSYTHLTLPTKA